MKSSHWRLIFPLASFLVSVALGQEVETAHQASTSRSSWRSNSEGWTRTSDYSVRGYEPRPTSEMLNRIAVTWENPIVSPLGSRATIRGQLVVLADKGLRKHVDWFQGIVVYVARQPHTKFDWSDGTNEQDTLECVDVVDPKGKFRLSIDLDELRRDDSQSQDFQIAIALAKHTGLGEHKERVEWNSKTPVIASTIQPITIPASPELSRELKAVKDASQWPDRNPDGVLLIRAVNALQPLGKQRALAVLEEFVESSDKTFESSEKKEIVFWIVRLLFEPIELEKSIPEPQVYRSSVDGEFSTDGLWPLNPMDTAGNIPFMVGYSIGGVGYPEHPRSHIKWANRHGVIRDEPLRPDTNPIAAAVMLMRSRKFEQLDDGEKDFATNEIYRQAIAMLSGILDPIPGSGRFKADLQTQWESRVREVANLNIAWDDAAERFVVNDGSEELSD